MWYFAFRYAAAAREPATRYEVAVRVKELYSKPATAPTGKHNGSLPQDPNEFTGI
jgi:hypothetical protein